MGGMFDWWNKNKFTVYDSEEKTVLKLIQRMLDFFNNYSIQLDGKTDLNGDHKGSWQGLNKPTLSDEGMRATVEKLNEDFNVINGKIPQFENTSNKNEYYINALYPPLGYTPLVGDYSTSSRNGTDNSPMLNDLALYCKTNNKKLFIPKGNYLLSSTVIIDGIDIEGQDAYSTIFYCKTNINAFNIVGSRRTIKNLHVWYDLNALAETSALAFKFGSTSIKDANAQFSNNIVEHLYSRYAYRGFTCEDSNTNATLWNNEFRNCRADFTVEYGYYFNAVVGSTTLSLINCFGNAPNVYPLSGTAQGFYINNIDDVTFINCQYDGCSNGNAIYVNTASNVTVNNFRTEGSKITSDNGQLIYANCYLSISGLKVEALKTNTTTHANIIRFGSNGRGEVGSISYIQVDIEKGMLYKVNTSGLRYGYGYVTILGADIMRGDCLLDDFGNKTHFATGTTYTSGANVPTVGNYEIGNHIRTVANAIGFTPEMVCIKSGSLGVLTDKNCSTTKDSRKIVFNNLSGVKINDYITITGVTGTKRILSFGEGNSAYLDSTCDATVTSATVTYSAPSFAKYPITEIIP